MLVYPSLARRHCKCSSMLQLAQQSRQDLRPSRERGGSPPTAPATTQGAPRPRQWHERGESSWIFDGHQGHEGCGNGMNAEVLAYPTNKESLAHMPHGPFWSRERARRPPTAPATTQGAPRPRQWHEQRREFSCRLLHSIDFIRRREFSIPVVFSWSSVEK